MMKKQQTQSQLEQDFERLHSEYAQVSSEKVQIENQFKALLNQLGQWYKTQIPNSYGMNSMTHFGGPDNCTM
jgi:hypothetical protein